MGGQGSQGGEEGGHEEVVHRHARGQEAPAARAGAEPQALRGGEEGGDGSREVAEREIRGGRGRREREDFL